MHTSTWFWMLQPLSMFCLKIQQLPTLWVCVCCYEGHSKGQRKTKRESDQFWFVLDVSKR